MTKDVVIASLDPADDDGKSSDELCALLDARLAEHAANPNGIVSWEDAKKCILAQ